MKIVFINPNTGRAERIENEAAWPQLGLLYLGAVLQNAGHEVKIILANLRARTSFRATFRQLTGG